MSLATIIIVTNTTVATASCQASAAVAATPLQQFAVRVAKQLRPLRFATKSCAR